ncbi:phage baseplate assembly protein V [Chromobacterium violaceum]|uniref:phage baseplate assembly protein V n=1 Tax=Chromobacterium violaceum TaxID=536 RepID=UPI00143DF007|nr:phage baseplate assembly protein V [Chromobacterium violaceum]QIY81513.1 phage baseplate protein [Chromobacterium violaceum]
MSIGQLSQALTARSPSTTMPSRKGTISAYDPGNYAVKVLLQPDGVETGWIQLDAVGVGNGWGLACGPQIGDEVSVEFTRGNTNAGSVVSRHFNDENVPIGPPSGETWMVHKTGASLKLTNDGNVTATDPSGTVLQLSNDGNVRITGNLVVSGNTTIQGTTTSHGQITGQGGMAVSGGNGASVAGNMAITGGDVTADSISLKGHRHGGVQTGGGVTGVAQ